MIGTINVAALLTVIGLLVTLVTIITEVTKEIGFLKKIPTDLQVIILSIILCLVTYFAYVAYIGNTVVWYYVVGTIFGAFIVAYVAMYGWSKLIEIYNRFKFKTGS